MDAAEAFQKASSDTKITKEASPGELDSHQAVIESALTTERQRIARVLHNEILQAFAACLVKAQLCEKLGQMERYDLVGKELPVLQDALNHAIDTVRGLEATLKRSHGESTSA